ncbi:MAG TPA: extracellular solute-binding protein [Actinomycetota bacterium]|nr:extracellular solute-binding protein [Actinomycetota bacterium]
MLRRSFAGPIVVVVLAAVVGGCGADRDALTIYSGRDEALVGPLLERFSEETGIPIDVRYGDSADLAVLLAEEGENTPADVFFSQTPGAVGYLDEQGLLAELPRDLLGKVDPKFEASDGRWIGLTARQRVLVYNEKIVDEADLPESVFDLTQPQYAGEVALAPSNGSFQDFVSAMALIEGEDVAQRWLDAMAAGGAPTYADNNSIVDAVARGEVAMGLANHYYNYRFLEEDPLLPSRNYVFPDGDIGALLIASTVSVVESSEATENAQKFVEFLLEEEAQNYFAEETFEYPLASGVAPSPELPPLDMQSAPDFDIDRLGAELERTTKMIAESGLLD